MNRRLWLAGSLGLLTGGIIRPLPAAQEDDAKVPTGAQLDPQLSVQELQERFGKVLGSLSGEAFDAKLVRMVRPLDAEHLQSGVAAAQRSVTTIFEKREFTPAFRWSLEVDLQVFEGVGAAVERSQPLVLSMLNNVASATVDLVLKARALASTGKGDVEVTVHTLKSSKEELGCRVYYAPYMHDDAQHRVKFDKFSSPTTDYVPAGKWWIWAVKNNQDGPKDELECGDDQRPKRTIHIDAP